MRNREVRVAPDMAKENVAGTHVSNNPGTKNGSTVGLGCDSKVNAGSTSNNVRKGRRVRTKTKGKGGGTNSGEHGSNGSNSGGVSGSKGGSTSSTKVVGSSSSFHNKRNDQSGTGGSIKSSQQKILTSAKDGSGSGARQKQQSHVERSNKSEEDVLIQFGSLLVKGYSRALVAQADFQQTSNYDEFIVKVRSIVESSNTGDRVSNKVVKEGGMGGVNRVGSNSNRRNQRKGGNNDVAAASAVPAIAECDRVVVPAASPTTSGSGLDGDSTAGHVPNCSHSIVGGKPQHNVDRQQGTTDEPMEWTSSCCSQDALKSDFLPPSNSPSISLDDRFTANGNSLLLTNVRKQHMLHEVGRAPPSSPVYNDTTAAAAGRSNGNSTPHNPKIGGENSVDDMLAASFGLSFLSPELMPISRDHEPEPRGLGMQQVQTLKQHHHEKKWVGQATWQEQESTCQQHKHSQCNHTSFGSTDNAHSEQQQHQTLCVPQELWLHGVKSGESRNEPSPLLASNWQQAQQHHEQQHQSSQCALPLGHEPQLCGSSAESWNESSISPQANFQQAYQDEDDGRTTTYCRNDGNASQWKETEDRHWNQPTHPFTSPSDFLRTLPSPTTSPSGDRLGHTTTTSGIQDSGGFTSTSVRGISNFEHTTSMTAAALLPPHQSTTHHHQLKLPLQLESETVQSLPLPNMDVGTIWITESPQLTSVATQKSQHPYQVHQPSPILQHLLQQPQYHHHRVPSGFEDIGVGSVSRLSCPPPPLVHSNIATTTTDTTVVVDHSPPDLPSMKLHHPRYNAVHELGGHRPVIGSGPGSQSHCHHSEVPTSDINNEGSKLLQMLQAAKGGVNDIGGKSVEMAAGMHMSSAVCSGENYLSQGHRDDSNLEISIAEEAVKKSPSPHGTPQQPSFSHNKHVVGDSSCNSPLVNHSSLQDDSLQVLNNHNQQQQQQRQHDEKILPNLNEAKRTKKIDDTPDKKKDKKDVITSPQKSSPSLRSCSKQIGKILVQGLQDESGLSLRHQHGAVFVRPKCSLPVQWELPVDTFNLRSDGKIKDEIETCGDNVDQNHMVGIYRLGVSSNTSCVISKPLFGKDERPNVNPDGCTVSGSVFFFAPKSSGMFIFRIYDENDPYETLVNSIPWGVAAQGRDVEMNIRIILSQLRQPAVGDARGIMRALHQLSFTLRHMTGMPIQRFAKGMAGTMWQAVAAAWDQLNLKTDDDLDDKKDSSSDCPRVWGLHVVVRDVISAVLYNPVCRRLLELHGPGLQLDPSKVDLVASAAAPLQIMAGWQQLWCGLDSKFCSSKATLASHHLKKMGFKPNAVPLHDLSMGMFNALTGQMHTTVQKLLPSKDFYIIREGVRKRIQDLIARDVPLVPKGTILQVFGSSVNGFAMDNVDLDMVLMYPFNAVAPERPKDVIQELSKVLNAERLKDVDSRPTARIPIVLFTDPETGIECDISIMNPLAVRNSSLLKTYASIDHRVRSIGYIMKYWAKQRGINNATQGTLCSYGYILCLINFLQTRVPPILPNLQTLPTEWQGLRPGSGSQHALPRVITRHPFNERDCNTYFFRPNDELQMQSLRKFASRNKESVGQLLASFFRHFAYEFDFRQNTISVRSGGCLAKELKAEMDCWPLNNRLSIEDPFETWYDVAHVLRWSRHRHVHIEFIRAYTLLANCTPDDVGGLLELLCEPSHNSFKNRHRDAGDDDPESLRDGDGGSGGNNCGGGGSADIE